ncbi:MAG TPA: DNA recombination protein RmuC [Bacilli bacterium]|nr:DNA recombination protein RmuC [Bacilli bacterium]HPY79690.1 DNA recombination protein RmuC [Bacilli bacterium]HQA55670.1 DNA recombination protein RmuC [Bacilli bacterium]
MEIATIILSSISLLVVIGLLFVIVKRKPQPVETKVDLKEIGALQKQIEFLSTQIKGDIELAVVKEMAKLGDQSIKNSELNNEKLERFQKAIADSLNTRFDALNKQMEDKIAIINQKVDEKLSEGFKSTNESMAQVRERLQAIDAAQKNIENLSKDVVSLKQVLEGNQTRGQYGEYQLSMVLHNVFGDTEGCYQEQYTLKKVKDGDDVRADAVVFMPEPNKMICIDSKFPFSDYAKMFDAQSEEEKAGLTKEFSNAVKKHITTIKDKYIVEGKTAPEALMFIPNDGVFAFIHHNCRDVIDYAREKKVILTSPSTMPAILVTINMVKIQVERAKNVEEINRQLKRLSKDFEMFAREWDKFSDDLEKTTRSREKLDTRVNKINTKFDAIRGNDKLTELEEVESETYAELTGEENEIKQ